MPKKEDIYNHLAKVYLNASSDKERESRINKGRERLRILLRPLSIACICFLLISITIILWQRRASQSPQVKDEIVIGSRISKINFRSEDLDSLSGKVITLNLNGINFLNYRFLGFSVRKSNYQDKLLMRVELIDTLGRKSRFYIDDIPAYKWKDYEIKLTDFQGVNDRAKICLLTFGAEDWKTYRKRAALYIDNIRLLK